MNAPQCLDTGAQSKWQELAPTLDLTHPGTADALLAYCISFSRWQTAEAQVTALGAVVRSIAGAAQVSPYVAVAKDSQRQMRQWGDVLGLHKSARRKATEPEAEGNGILKLLGSKRVG